MAKKNSQKESMERKNNILTTVIACVVLLCVLVTGVVIVVTKEQNKAAERVAWQSAFARYFGGDGEDALEILSRDYKIEMDDTVTDQIVTTIEGHEAADGYEWGIWLNGNRVTDRTADQIETKNGDVIVWKIVKINGDNDSDN
jgi:hypothetical protein